MASTAKKKAYKVRKGQTTYGVAVENFEELKTKGCERFNISDAKLEYIALEDGTIVDGDYIQTLPENTVLIFKEDTRTNVRHHYKTKSHYMRDKAKSRIRKYLDLTKTALLPTAALNKNDSLQGNAISKERAEEVIKAFHQTLKKHDYHGKIFDRSDNTGERICNEKGLFLCQGLFSQSMAGKQSQSCKHRHQINPYLRWDFVIEFSSWNLDHQIEKGKEVLPELKKAIKKSSRKVNVDYFYNLLFTMANMKLVHLVCHDKRDHGLKVDPEKVYLPL